MTTHVRDEPLINPGCALWSRKAFQDKSNPPKNPPVMSGYLEQKGELLIWDLWDWGKYCILDIQVVNMDTALTYIRRYRRA